MFLTLIVRFTIPIFIVILNVMWAHTEKTQKAYLNWHVITLFLLFVLYKAWWWISELIRNMWRVSLNEIYVVFDWKLNIFPRLNCTQRDAIKLTIFTVAGRFRLIQALEFWILGTSDPRNCKIFPPTTRFPYIQVTFNTGFPVQRYHLPSCSSNVCSQSKLK